MSERTTPRHSSLRWLGAIALAGGSALGCTSSEPGEPAPAGFVHVAGDQVFDGSGARIALEGLVLGDLYYAGSEPPYEAHTEEDYARVAAMGANLVRLDLNAAYLEGAYGDDGLKWLDDNVTWARNQGLYLVPGIAVPPEGSAIDCANDAFWASSELQERLVSLWRSLAAHYADEPTIAGYALFTAPNPSESIEQWKALAETLTHSIREVNPRHMLVVDRAISIGCTFDKPSAETFVRLDDPNVLYEFDRNAPWQYTAQLIQQEGRADLEQLPAFGPYPDPDRFTIDFGVATWQHDSVDSRPSEESLKLKPDETRWVERKFYYTVTDPDFEFAVPSLVSDDNFGKVYFDDITIVEISPTGSQTVVEIDLETLDDFFHWEGDWQGNQHMGTGVAAVEDDAHRGEHSISLSGTTSLSHLSGNSRNLAFLVTRGNTYEVTSWIKGENSSPDGVSLVKLEFWSYPSALHGFDRTTLEEAFDGYTEWGRTQRVPMNVFGFGTGRQTFENGLGGIQWTNDMIDIMRERNLHFAYWGYHLANFGIYSNKSGLPDPETVNQPLVDLLTEKLHER